MKAIILALSCSFLITLGQVFWKIALDKAGGLTPITIDKTLQLAFSPFLIIGTGIYILATLFWMYLISKYEYSYIYPMLSGVYIFAFLFAYFLFGESITMNKILGVGFIIIGIYFLNWQKAIV